jgi:hypothetical protein
MIIYKSYLGKLVNVDKGVSASCCLGKVEFLFIHRQNLLCYPTTTWFRQEKVAHPLFPYPSILTAN